MAEPVSCPECRGAGRKHVHIYRAGWQFVPCWECQGAGSFTPDDLARIAETERLRADRLARGLSLRDEAKRLGVATQELWDREQERS
jgi:hypothetical protein